MCLVAQYDIGPPTTERQRLSWPRRADNGLLVNGMGQGRRIRLPRTPTVYRLASSHKLCLRRR